MIRPFLLIILVVVVYQAAKTVVRSALSAYEQGGGTGRRRRSLAGEEMVQDPQCRTYVVKNRAVARRIDGTTAYFCSEACADAYTRGRRG
jgi:uncharacterized protein